MGYTYHVAATEKTTGSVGQEQLADLPAQLRKELSDALISLDVRRITDVVGRISDQDAALGSALSKYTDEYAYSPILQALRSSETLRS